MSRRTDWDGGMLQTAQKHGGSAHSLVAVKDWSGDKAGVWPSQQNVDLHQHKGGVAAQHQGVVDQLAGSLDGLGVT